MIRSEASTGKRPEAVRVWLLGGFRVSVGSRIIEEGAWRLRKSAALVKLLALASGHRLHREQIMDLLWPDSRRTAASNNLRKTLHTTRRNLDSAAGSGYLASEDESLVLCPEGELWVDADAFEEAAATARRSRDPAAYRAAIEFYAGDLLPEDRYEGWAEGRREQLRQLYLDLLIELATLYEGRDQYDPAVEVLRKAITEEPTNEEAHSGLMRLYALLGRKAEALAQFERLKEALLTHLGAEPGAKATRLRGELVTGTFPSARAQPSAPPPDQPSVDARHNLPASRDSFVGRERELREVKRELAMTRLLTLTGAGGSGKTRLALEVARDLVGAYPDGVWLVELASLSEGELVPQTVAAALGVREQPGQPLTVTLVESLRGVDEMLLILDNCEHLIDAAAHLVDTLLDSFARLRVLATSREALRVASEIRWAVPALSVPDPRSTPTVGELERSESVRLFAERSRQSDPAFALTPHNANAVAEMCRKLEGIPLAIELAAARAGTLSVEQISERLEHSLKLLTSGSRTETPRQRTLRGTLDWSHDLLGEQERVVFRRLSLFAGGWTLEAADAVVPGEDAEESDTLDLLSGLADKFLVVVEMARDGGVRYRLLEPVRQYALEKLDEDREAEAIGLRHAEFFLTLAEEAESRFRGPEEATWLNTLEVEHDNLRRALFWARETRRAKLGLELAAALWWFWSTRGHFAEGARWLKEALTGDAATEPAARAKALNGLGLILREQGDFGEAEACHEEAHALYEQLGNLGGVAESLACLGFVTENRGDAARAKVIFQESLTAARESGNRRIIPHIVNGLGWIEFADGNFERARKRWKETLMLAREQGSTLIVSGVLLSMGYTELAQGNYRRAMTQLAESLVLSREVGDRRNVSGCLLSLGIAATLGDKPEQAPRLLKESLTIDFELGANRDIAEDLESLAESAGALGEDARAARLWGAASALREVIGDSWQPAERMLHEPQRSAARTRTDEAVWEAAFAEGEAMTLEQAVEYALSEEESVTPTPQASDQLVAHGQPPFLTHREQEVAALVARGLTNRQIALELSVSEHTAATHVRRILKKLGIQSRAQIGSWLTQQRP